jgi:hypothetical protein
MQHVWRRQDARVLEGKPELAEPPVQPSRY